MGLIDPMVISNAAASGVIAFNTGPVLWAVTVALFRCATGAIVYAARPFRFVRSRAVTSAGTLRFATAGAAVK